VPILLDGSSSTCFAASARKFAYYETRLAWQPGLR
jgi:hypothetical protein